MPKTVSETPGCLGCPLQKLFPKNTFVPPQFPDLKKDLIRLVIAEAPGEEESKQGIPLVGGSGRIFNKLLEKTRIPREGLTVLNCIQCRPPNNVFPTDPEAKSYISKSEAQESIAHCKRAHVDPVLASRDWRRVDLLGDKPLKIVAGKKEGIGKWRGSVIDIPNTKSKGIATYHPSYLIRDQVFLAVAANDLIKSLIVPPEFYNLYPSIEDVRAFKFKKFALDLETTYAKDPEIICVGLCARPNFALVVPFRGEYKTEIKRIILESEELIGQNLIQFDLPILFKALEIEWNN